MKKTFKTFFAPAVRGLGGAARRAAMTLLVVMLTSMTAWAEDVETYYVDADGTQQNVTATVLTGSETSLAAGTYLVNSNITYDHKLMLGNGTVNIILADGMTMSIGTDASPIQDNGITGAKWSYLPVLHIYGQTTDTDAAGSLEVYSHGINGIDYYTQHSSNVKSDVTTDNGNAITIRTNFTLKGGNFTATAPYTGIYSNGDVIINGGILNATTTATNSDFAAIYGDDGVTINGGQVTATATATNGAKGIESENGDITLGYSRLTDFIEASSYSVGSEKKVKVKDGLKMKRYDDTYEGDLTDNLSAIANKKLQPVTTNVYFRINYSDGINPTYQKVCYGLTATEPTVEARTGYNISGWYTDSDCTDGNEFDFTAAVTTTSYIYLYAKWTPITYYVEFDKNNENATGTMERQTLTYGEHAELNECTFTYEGHALGKWTTAADGTGESYGTESPFNSVYNLANVQGTVITLYAQWGKDISTCKNTTTVPDQTLDGNSYIWYKFEAANYGNASTGVKVMDGNKVLTLGTDYCFKNVIYKNARDDDETMPHELGDECILIIQGIGEYAGTLTSDFKIVSPEAEGTWGDLAWSINSKGDFTISRNDEVTDPVAMSEPAQGNNYPWYSKANGIQTITIGEGITSIGANAFAGTSNVHDYGNVYKLTLPSTLTTIGENAFAYCSSLTIDLDAILAMNITIGTDAFAHIGCLTGTLADNADNATKIALLSQANANVTLSGRTLYKDGNWNTICLPFGLGDSMAEEGHHFDDTPFAGATVMRLNGTDSEFDTSTGSLKLNFSDAKSISAGTPYIIKWDGDGSSNLVNPEFTGVSILTDTPTPVMSGDEKVSFNGTFCPETFNNEDKSVLFLGVNNQNQSTLYYPDGSAPTSINAFRAYFHVDLSGSANGVRAYVLYFGDDEDTTGVVDVRCKMEDGRNDGWYDLSGRKLDGKPTLKGIYINHGHKVVIK